MDLNMYPIYIIKINPGDLKLEFKNHHVINLVP
jgi:hypothetical protein